MRFQDRFQNAAFSLSENAISVWTGGQSRERKQRSHCLVSPTYKSQQFSWHLTAYTTLHCLCRETRSLRLTNFCRSAAPRKFVSTVPIFLTHQTFPPLKTLRSDKLNELFGITAAYLGESNLL